MHKDREMSYNPSINFLKNSFDSRNSPIKNKAIQINNYGGPIINHNNSPYQGSN